MLNLEGLHLRAAFFRFIRSFFFQEGFLEVDTPIRQPVTIPESNILPFHSDHCFLQTSPELCMKRLLAAGCDKIFQICHCFRKEERGRLHLEEFQMLEWYRVGKDYNDLMEDCERLLRFLCREFQQWNKTSEYDSSAIFSKINLDGPWEKISVEEAFKKYSVVDMWDALRKDIFDEILVEHIEPYLGIYSPVFLYDYPVELGSLARPKKEDPNVVERFELYIQGVELANGFSELTDDVEQRKRFLTEANAIEEKYGHSTQLPELFLDDLKKLDDAAGIALGIDRLFLLAIGGQSIADVIPFSWADLSQ